MGFLDRLRAAFETRLAAPSPSKKEPLRMQVHNRTFRIDINMKIWREAVNIAMAPMRPRREELYMMYTTAMEDPHLLAQVRTARFTVQMAPYKIMRNGKEDKKIKEQLLDTPWFHEYLEYAVDSEIYGHSLVEILEKDKDGRITKIWTMYREHVRPWMGQFVIDTGMETGISYKEAPWNKHLIEIGKPDDLGLLKVLSKLVIRKEYNVVDWGRRNERFGMPTIIVKTTTRDKKELDAKEDWLRNFGANGYAILDDADTFELKESMANTGGAHVTYKDFAQAIDDAISELVNGQTGTMDEKAYVGSAEVHERILNKYIMARMRRIQNHINFELFPWLIQHHEYPLDGCKLVFTDLEEKDPKLATDPKKQPDPEPGPSSDPDEKKSQ